MAHRAQRIFVQSPHCTQIACPFRAAQDFLSCMSPFRRIIRRSAFLFHPPILIYLTIRHGMARRWFHKDPNWIVFFFRSEK